MLFITKFTILDYAIFLIMLSWEGGNYKVRRETSGEKWFMLVHLVIHLKAVEHIFQSKYLM